MHLVARTLVPGKMVGAAKPRVRYKCVAPRRRSTTQTAPPPQQPASSSPIDKKLKKKKKDKKKKKADDDDDKEEKDEAEDGDDEDKVYRRGTAVYFVGDISVSSVTTMRTLLDEACNLALKYQNTIDKPSVTLYIHSLSLIHI